MSGIYRFINTNLPTEGCNLRCEYCYIRQHGDEDMLKIDRQKKLFAYPTDYMLRALRKERMGGVCMFNISGTGETLLNSEIFRITYGLLEEGHYVALISNCTITKVIEQFGDMPLEYRHRLFFKASFHYRELKKRGLLQTYVRNIHFMKKREIAFSIEIVSNDYVLDELDELKEFCLQNFGALPHILAGRDESVRGTYPKYETKLPEWKFRETWASFDSELFRYQDTDYVLPHNNEFCYAGVYTGCLNLESGTFAPCPGGKVITNFFENIEQPVQFAPVGACPFPYCFCGFFLHVLAGVAREKYEPNVKFFQFRDRQCEDGSTWLTPSIREVFSHRCAEYHDDFAPDKKRYFISLMQIYYGSDKFSTDQMRALSESVGKNLHDKNVCRIAIYGMGKIGNWLLAILEETDISVVCGIDQRAGSIESSIPIVGCDEMPEDLDAVVVSVFYEYTHIAPMLREKTKALIMSACELA